MKYWQAFIKTFKPVLTDFLPQGKFGQLLIGLSVFLLIFGGCIFWFVNSYSEENSFESLTTESIMSQSADNNVSAESVEEQQAATSNKVAEAASSQTTTGYVDIKGAVNKPSLYPIDGEMRVYDVIELAGGLTAQADQTRINLAQRVTDQMVIYIPKDGEKIPELPVTTSVNNESESGTAASSEGIKKVNINTADATQLQTISGIGEKKAADIIQYREANGPFKAVDELTAVSGIGEKTLEKIRQEVCAE